MHDLTEKVLSQDNKNEVNTVQKRPSIEADIVLSNQNAAFEHVPKNVNIKSHVTN